jgi:glycine betaine/proline transport system substrate-binding protein
MKKAKLGIVAVAAASMLALAACNTSNTGGTPVGGDKSGGSNDDIASKYAKCDVEAGVKDASSMKIDSGEDKKVTITAFSGWAESAATAYVMKDVLTKEGYQPKVETLDAAPAFTAVAQGDYDMLSDVWLPSTHKDYIDKYGDKMEPQGCWFDSATIEIAVPSYSPAKSIGDLKTMADKYNNEIIGIEPGAGETKTMQDSTIPKYGLDGLKFKTSSTSAMLRSLDTAYKQHKNVAVTLWSPHWAYSKYDLRKLKDPKDAMSGTEGIWNFSRKGFTSDHPLASQLFKNLVWPEDKLNELENLMVQKYDNKDPDKAVAEWLKKNPDFEKQLIAGQLKK